jgi:hypothetical protein
MSYYRRNPRARGAYRAAWSKVWQARLATGAVSTDEEEGERKALLLEVAGVDSSSKLTEEQHTAVMLALNIELGPEDRLEIKDPVRMRKIAKIGHLARALRPEDPESYIMTIVNSKFRVSKPTDWRQRLTRDEIHMLMLDLVEQEKRNKRKEVGFEINESNQENPTGREKTGER